MTVQQLLRVLCHLPKIAVAKGLNTAQADAVTTLDGPLLVLSVERKTRVLTARLAQLVAGGRLPLNILAVTSPIRQRGNERARLPAGWANGRTSDGTN